MSSTKTLSAEKYSAVPFFKFTMRQNLQHLALYLVIAVLAMILPTVIIINDFNDRILNNPDWEYSVYLADDVTVIAAVGLLVAGGIAVLAGMSAGAYVNSKTSVGCFHSFPLKREVILGCECLTRVIYFAVTMIFGYAVPYLIMLAALPTDAVMLAFGDYWRFALAAVFVFLIVFSLLIFSAGLTGNAVTRLLMAALIVCLPAALYALIVALAAMGCDDLYDGYYLNDVILRKIFVPLRGYYGVEKLILDKNILPLLTILIDTAFYSVGAVLLHKYRRSEASGTSIIWKPVFLIVKLAVVVVCTLFGAWFFSAAMGMSETLALFIGAVIGGVLSFIVANCILYRSSRSMFRGLKSFGITMAVLFVFMLLVPLNITGMIGRFYSAGATDEFIIRMSPYGAEITYDDDEDIAMLYEMFTDDRAMYSGDTYPIHPVYNSVVYQFVKPLDAEYKTTYDSRYTYNLEENGVSIASHEEGIATYSITVIQKPKFGIPLAVRVDSDVNSVFTDTVTATEEFAEAMNIAEKITIDDVVEAEINLDVRTLYMYDNIGKTCTYDDGVEHTSFCEVAGIRDCLEQILLAGSYNSEYRETSPVVGRIIVYYETDYMATSSYSSRASITLPIYAHDIELINAVDYAMTVAQCERDGVMVDYNPIESAAEYYERALSRYDDKNEVIILTDCETGKLKEIDAETLLSVADDTSSFLVGTYYYTRSFEVIGTSKYLIVYSIDGEDDIQVRFRRGTDIEEKLAALLEG